MKLNEYRFTASISTDGFTSKPTQPGKLTFKRQENMSISDLSTAILTGHSFTGDFGFTEFPTYRHKNYANFKGSSLFSFDFDNSEYQSLDELVTTLTIKPFIAYETFSHQMEGKGNRYRIIYAFKQPITDVKQYKQLGLWLAKQNDIKEYDRASLSAVQVMHGTKSSAKLLQVGNVLDVPYIKEYVDTDKFTSEPTAEEMSIISEWKKRNSKKVDEQVPHLIESPNDIELPDDIKYVSDEWMKENGYMVDVFGSYLVHYRKTPLKDGERRKFKLYHIIKGIAQLNHNASLNDLLVWGWWSANQICKEKLTRDEVVTIIFNAYHAVRVEKKYDTNEKFNHSKGYGVFPGRRSAVSKDEYVKDVRERMNTEEWKENVKMVAEVLGYEVEDTAIDTSNFLGIDPNSMVLCTADESTTTIKGFHFYTIQKEVKEKVKRDYSKYYTKKQNRIKDFDDFADALKEYDGKVSVRKVYNYLKEKGFSCSIEKVTTFTKCYGILHNNSSKITTEHIESFSVKKRNSFSDEEKPKADEYGTPEQREKIRKELEESFRIMLNAEVERNYRMSNVNTANDLISLIDDELVEVQDIRPYYLQLPLVEQLTFENRTNDKYVNYLIANRN